jgi:hypothetical protein
VPVEFSHYIGLAKVVHLRVVVAVLLELLHVPASMPPHVLLVFYEVLPVALHHRALEPGVLAPDVLLQPD